MKNTPSNSVSEVTTPSSRPTRLSPLVAGIAAAVMSMTAVSPATAENNVQIGIGNVIKKGGNGGRDATARAEATSASEAAKDAQARLTIAESTLAQANAKAASADAAAKDAQTRLAIVEKKLAELEGKVSGLPSATSPGASEDKDDKDDKGDKKSDKGDDTETQPSRAPTAEEIVNARAVIETRAQVAKAQADAARAEAAAKAARVVVLQAQLEKARAAAELARAKAAEKAAKLAQAQAEADAADKKAVGLAGEASTTQDNLAEAQRQSDEANGKLSAADAQAANAKALLDAYGASRQQSVVVRDGSTPSFYGEAAGTFGVFSGRQSDVHGGASVGAFARVGEHVAVGVRTNIEASSRTNNVGGQSVPGSSTAITAQGAVQLGTVQGSGVVFEGAAGMQRESMNGVATGFDGARLEGVSKTYGRVDLGASWFAQLSGAVRLKVGAAVTFLAGRPVEMGSDAKETAVGGTVNIGISTK